jgi:hypothetical protein
MDGIGLGDGLSWLRGAVVGGGGLEEWAEAVAKLREGVAEGEEAVEQDGAGEVKGVAGGVEVAFQGGRLPAAERQ